MMGRPLEGVRILAVEQFGAGPYGTMALADLGAEVIKIEDPATRGDVARTVPPYRLSETDGLYFQVGYWAGSGPLHVLQPQAGLAYKLAVP